MDPRARWHTSARCLRHPVSPAGWCTGLAPAVRRARGSGNERGAAIGPDQMNRTGLVIALVMAAVVGVLFAVYPRLDIDISAFFYDRPINLFKVNAQPWVNFTRDAVRWVTALIFAPAVLVLIGKLIMPKRHMPMGGRAALFLILTMALGPGVLTNL